MQTVKNLGVNEVFTQVHELHGQYQVERVNGTYYNFIRDNKIVKTLPESEILNGIVGIAPALGVRKNRRETRKARRNRKNYSRTN